MEQPVLYLDLDDTVISWRGGRPAAAPGLGAFLEWALATFEVRWLTRWARTGIMDPRLLDDLARLSGVAVARLAGVRGLPWGESDCKLDGIAWSEHVVLGRPFLWMEDETIGTAAVSFLERHGFGASYVHCNVTADADALRRVHHALALRYARGVDAGERVA